MSVSSVTLNSVHAPIRYLNREYRTCYLNGVRVVIERRTARQWRLACRRVAEMILAGVERRAVV